MSHSLSIVSIIPKLPPAIDGVGDYALNLARQLHKEFNIQTHFIVGDPAWTGAAEIEGFAVSQVSDHSINALLTLLPSDRFSTILLHYVGYGYAKRGCPVWLVDGLERWKNLSPNRSLITMFHEISASGPVWTSAFWLSQLQKNLAARLAKLSDRCITSKQLYANILHKLSGGKHTQITALPVFSNVGEPKQLPSLTQRHPHLVVFGGCSNRRRVYQESMPKLIHVCQLLEIEKIIDIGPSTGLTLLTINGVPIVEMGQQSTSEISSILSKSLAGFLDYNPDFLAKSTIFAAYSSHGILPISAQCSAIAIDGIKPGKDYWFIDEHTAQLINWQELQTIASQAHTWYQTHNLGVQAKIFASHFNSRY